MFKDPTTAAINATVNRQLLEAHGMPGPYAQLVADAITALDGDYRLVPADGPLAVRLYAAGMSLTTIARSLRPL
jgi:hypothetical protein